MSFNKKYFIKGIPTRSASQEKVIWELVDEGFCYDGKEMVYNNGLCEVTLESASGYKATIDCYGRINGLERAAFNKDYMAYLQGVLDNG